MIYDLLYDPVQLRSTTETSIVQVLQYSIELACREESLQS
jgi:hypothetical protein